MVIKSRHNETLKAIRRLRQRQGSRALLEGPHLVGEALDAGLAIETLLMTPAFLRSASGEAIAARTARSPLEVDAALLAEHCDADAPRGVLAVVDLPRPTVAAVPLGGDFVVLFLDGVQDPGNLGALARVGAAFGAAALLLAPGCCHPNHPRALRASAGSLLRLPVAQQVEPGDLDAHWLRGGVRPRWIGLEAHGGTAIPSPPPPGALVLALGAERGGLSPAAAGRLDERWTIPLRPPVESLNVAVAAGVALFALARSGARGG